MADKITWNKIHKDFKQRHPNLSKEVIHWQPYAYATIKLWMKDGSKIVYNYDNHRATFVND